MKILFTGFTSRTVGSDRLQYDFISNVFVLERALRLAGHTVDTRPVSILTDPCVEEDYDCAVVGIAAVQGLSSRFKVGALWTLSRFGKRAGLFPSDGRNLYTFPSSVLTCLTGRHEDNGVRIDPIDYMLGALQRERNNVLEAEEAKAYKDTWRAVLLQLPHATPAKCAWPLLVPAFSWGSELVYRSHFGAAVTLWDPTNVAIPMQFDARDLDADGRIDELSVRATNTDRQRRWVLSSLQDQSQWLKKQKGVTWPVVTIGNKRSARKGEGEDYIPEKQLIADYYGTSWGHLAFGYPLADGGWWRMRYVHAAMAGCVTIPDANDARKMPAPFSCSALMTERRTTEGLASLARDQWAALQAAAWPVDRAVETVDRFVKGLVA